MRAVCDGLVLRESAYGENDKLICVLTADEGKVLMTAKGARSMRSRFLPLCRLFTYANLEYYEKGGRRWLSGGSVNDSFYGLNSDIQGFALASYIVSLASEITGEGEPCAPVLQMTLNTLYAIEKRLKPLWQIKSAYEIFAANISGFAPDMTGCDECGAATCADGFWLDVMNGRIVCSQCFSKRHGAQPAPAIDENMTASILLPVDNGVTGAWQYVLKAPPKRIFSFSLNNEESAARLARATEAYIVNHLERTFDTLEFYNAVKE